ncbi:MAG: stationary-phase survival protein SurE [Acidimicrobiaceae bacterium]|nr:stationary-phase survival protein SurE [Acidimicrobiaceae bacterium]
MRVLVTNDDGVEAPGIAALVVGLLEEGHEVTVVAPVRDMSGAGTGTGPQRREIIDRFAYVSTEIAGAPAYGLDGLPALCVTAACAGAFGPEPDLVIAGVNAGRNVGRSVLHSGTVGAAFTAAQLGKPAIATSVQTVPGQTPFFSTAVWLALRLAPFATPTGKMVLNCNAPARPVHQLTGIRLAPLGDTGLVRSAHVVDGVLEMEFLRPNAGDVIDTDEALSDQGYATVTPVVGAALAGGVSRADLAGRLLVLESELLGSSSI